MDGEYFIINALEEELPLVRVKLSSNRASPCQGRFPAMRGNVAKRQRGRPPSAGVTARP